MITIKGYYIESGYMGWTGEKYELFASEEDYKEWMEDEDSDNKN